MAFVDQGEFEAMKTLSGRRAPRCDKHQFRAKMRDIVVEHSGLNKKERKKNTKNGTLLPHTFAFSCLPCVYVLLHVDKLCKHYNFTDI